MLYRTQIVPHENSAPRTARGDWLPRRVRHLNALPHLALIAMLALMATQGLAQVSSGQTTIWTLESPPLNLPANAYDNFGEASVFADFNCDGFEDAAIGVPGYSFAGTDPQGGIVRLLRGGPSGFVYAGAIQNAQVGGATEEGDRFGSVLVTGNFNGDQSPHGECADLAVGIPLETVGTAVEAGAIAVVYGEAFSNSLFDLSASQTWHQNSPNVFGSVEAGDHFGAALAAGDFDGDGIGDLAVSAPDETIAGVQATGFVVVLHGSVDRLTASIGDPSWTGSLHQGLDIVDNEPLSFERFGAALAACDLNGDLIDELIVGVPGERTAENSTSRGALHTFFGNGAIGLDLDQESLELAPANAQPTALGLSLAGGDFDPARVGCEVAAGDPLFFFGSGRVRFHKPFPTSTNTAYLVLTESSFDGEDADPNERFGGAIQPIDSDGDGADELLIGASNEDGPAQNSGAVFWWSVAGDRPVLRIDDLVENIGPYAQHANLGGVFAVSDSDNDGWQEAVFGLPRWPPELGGPGRGIEPPLPGAGALVTVNLSLIFSDGFESGDTGSWQ